MTSERPSERLTVNGASLRQFKGIHALFQQCASSETSIPGITAPQVTQDIKKMCMLFQIAIMWHRTGRTEEAEEKFQKGQELRSQLRGEPAIKNSGMAEFMKYVVANTLEETSRLYRNAADPNYSGEDPPAQEEDDDSLRNDLHSALTRP